MNNLFESIEIFRDLTPSELMDIIRTCKIRQLVRGEVIFEEGAAAAAMYVLQDGQIRIMQMMPDGVPEILANLGPGDVTGEIALIDGSPRTATAVCVADATVYQMDRQDFNVLRANAHPAAFKVIHAIARILSRRLRSTNQKIAQFFEDPDLSLRYLRSRHQTAAN